VSTNPLKILLHLHIHRIILLFILNPTASLLAEVSYSSTEGWCFIGDSATPKRAASQSSTYAKHRNRNNSCNSRMSCPSISRQDSLTRQIWYTSRALFWHNLYVRDQHLVSNTSRLQGIRSPLSFEITIRVRSGVWPNKSLSCIGQTSTTAPASKLTLWHTVECGFSTTPYLSLLHPRGKGAWNILQYNVVAAVAQIPA
jgi:hypothetical protein